MAYQGIDLLSTKAAGDDHGENSSYFDGWKAYDTNPFDLRHNRGGVIQMGLAENQLSLDLIEEWSKNHPEASICTPEGVSQFKRIANFQDYHGLPEFRKAMAQFMGQVRGGKATFDPDRVVMSGGATGAQETLAFCLANPGEAFLVPTPYYPAFDRDCCWRSGIKLLPIECHSFNDFRLTKEALVSAYDGARRQGISVKGILITNPSNPLGTITDRDTLAMLATFATEHRVHLVCDEIYAGSVFATPEYVSIAEVIERDVPWCNRDLIHVVYSLSKDFGLPGFRVGIIYSYNDAVVAAARRMSSFGLVSSQTQYFLARMLSDEEFIGRFLQESKCRLVARHERFTSGLREVGIGCLRGNAGLFSWMDLRRMLREKTARGGAGAVAGDRTPGEAERVARERRSTAASPGGSASATPTWTTRPWRSRSAGSTTSCASTSSAGSRPSAGPPIGSSASACRTTTTSAQPISPVHWRSCRRSPRWFAPPAD
ncbi:hypothetical protein OsJ_15874 [Oryza sativa Japonica Group]|uniref:1-aminocyclopropane-1-carboxylate synthase n=1 Tax=Oryza sativa subsp. japonica TaxID=39947 RepID=A3AWN6_ORYSJ|nr:hypothetical protein OsJ_15874 [Oryza sativa Japonica Group]